MSEENNDIRVQLAALFEEHDYNKRYERLSVVYYMINGKIEFYQAIKDVPRKIPISDKDYWTLATISVSQDNYSPGGDNPSDDNSAIEILNMNMGDMILPSYRSTSNETQIMLYTIVHDATSPVTIDKVKINNVLYNAVLDNSAYITENDCYVVMDNTIITNDFLEENEMTLEDVSLILGTEVNIGDMLLSMQISLLQTYSGTIAFELITNYGNAVASISGLSEEPGIAIHNQGGNDYNIYTNQQVLQYKIDDSPWTTIYGNSATIRIFPYLDYTIYARALDETNTVVAEAQENVHEDFNINQKIEFEAYAIDSNNIGFIPQFITDLDTNNYDYKVKIDNGEYTDDLNSRFIVDCTISHTLTFTISAKDNSNHYIDITKTIAFTQASSNYITLNADPNSNVYLYRIWYSEDAITWHTPNGNQEVIQIPSTGILYLKSFSELNVNHYIEGRDNIHGSISGNLNALLFPDYIIDDNLTDLNYSPLFTSITINGYINAEQASPMNITDWITSLFSGNKSTIRYNYNMSGYCLSLFSNSALEYPPAIDLKANFSNAFAYTPLKEFPIMFNSNGVFKSSFYNSCEDMLLETPLVVSQDDGETISFGSSNDAIIQYPLFGCNTPKELALYFGCVTGIGCYYKMFVYLNGTYKSSTNKIYTDLHTQTTLKDHITIPNADVFDCWTISILEYNSNNNNKWEYVKHGYLSDNINYVYDHNDASKSYIQFTGNWFTSAGLKPYITLTTDNNTDYYNLHCKAIRSTIYYTTDGTTPTTSSQVYTTPIQYQSGLTIKAIAVLDNLVSEMFTLSL